jgi:thioredoxin reductase (NADPH)
MEASEKLDLLIVGGGPAGLAVAIAARQAELRCLVVEKGALVNSIFFFPRQMVFFTTPDLLEIGGLPFVTPYEKPTQAEALKYYRRVCDTYRIPLALGEEVGSLQSTADGFRVESVRAADATSVVRQASNVAIATGYYDHPNHSASPARSCRTSRTTGPRRTRSIASRWWWWAARTRRRSRLSSSTAPAPA